MDSILVINICKPQSKWDAYPRKDRDLDNNIYIYYIQSQLIASHVALHHRLHQSKQPCWIQALSHAWSCVRHRAHKLKCGTLACRFGVPFAPQMAPPKRQVRPQSWRGRDRMGRMSRFCILCWRRFDPWICCFFTDTYLWSIGWSRIMCETISVQRPQEFSPSKRFAQLIYT